MTIQGRYSTIDKAIIAATGNSLVICGDASASTINTSDMMTSNGGTTRDYSLAGSSAHINILNNSTILYAELVWLSTVKSTAVSATDVRSIQSNPITFLTPKGSNTITPDYISSYTSPLGTVDTLRAANVTSIISSSLSGTYTVSNVPTSIPSSGLSDVRAGWSLTVIYRNNTFAPKRIVYAIGLEAATSTNPIQATFAGFTTEDNPDYLKGEMVLITANGNPLDGTDIVKLGPSFGQLTTIGNPKGTPSPNPGTAPNNPWNSFSCGQINIADTLNPNIGLIDISGTKGSENHDGFVPIQSVGARNKWDITCVDISNVLTVNQTQLAGQYTVSNTDDAIELVAFASQVNSQAPNIVATLNAYDVDGDNEYNINVGERVVYIVQINNSGKTTATNVTLSTTLNPAIQFVPNTVTLNGVTQPGADITKSVNIGSIPPSGVANVSFTIKALSLVQGGGTADTVVNYNYSFISGASAPTYINYADTNTISLIVQNGNLNVVKAVSSNTTTLKDTLVYTTTITNTGSETAFDIQFQDKINPYCIFNTGTVTINGTSYNTYDPNDGFPIASLAPNATATVVFSVTVNSLTPNTVVDNGALVTFSYIFNQYLVPITKTILSSIVNIQIQFSDIMGRRTANNFYPNVGDIVTYTLLLTNIGNVDALNFNVIEPPVPGATFVDGSVYINGERKLGANPFTGIILDSIPAQSTTTMTYQVLVNSIQPNQIIQNIARVPFDYQIAPTEPIIYSEQDSNLVTTRTNFVIMNMPETVDKAYATTGDILYYSVNMTNTGNIDAINTTFLSAIQAETSFVVNSVAINGVPYSGYNPNLGFSVGDIPPGNTVNVTYQAKVNSVPSPNIVYNQGELVYSFKPDPNGPAVTNTIMSNTVTTTINTASFTFIKSVDKDYAVIGDYLIYKCNIVNTGTVSLTNVYFNDEISTYTKFVPETVYVNGTSYPDYDPSIGFAIDSLHPSDTTEIIFATQILTAPPFGYVLNMGEMLCSYKINPNSPIITNTTKSNPVQTKVVNGNLSLTKSVNLSYATIGDIINYSFNISNTGNVTVNNTFFFDSLPPGLTLVPNSVLVNGTSMPSFDPVAGFSLDSLNVGQVVTVSFNATVTSIPVYNNIVNSGSASYIYVINPAMPPVEKTSTSNNVTTVLNKGSATLSKTVDKIYATVNDVLTYTITANNTGTVTLTNVAFTDLIPSGAVLVPNSVVINNIGYSGYDPNIGFILPNILPGGTSVVSFKATVTNLPTPPEIDNYAKINYKYNINPSGPSYNGSATSNTEITYINQVTITNTKTVDKIYAQVNDVLTYTSVIKNNGNVSISNTNFVDIIASQLTFNNGSVTINGTPYSTYNPTVGFTISNLPPNGTATVVFTATVASVPESGVVTNKSTLYYNYRINPSGPDIIASKDSNTVTTNIVSGTLTITKEPDRYYARLTDVVNYTFVIANTGNTTLSNLSFQDIIQRESTFNAGSVYVDGINKVDFNPNTGFTLDNMAVGKFTTLTFAVTVNSLPTDGKLYNTGTISYSYKVDPAQNPIYKNQTSNQTTIYINNALITATKSVDKATAKIGDTLNFSISLYNAGTAPAQFINFTDALVNYITFTPGTLTINSQSTSYDPNITFPIDDIAAGITTTIAFKATITSRPPNNIITNYAVIDYKYKVNPSDTSYVDILIDTNTTTTYVAVAEVTLNKTVDKMYATVEDTLSYTVHVTNTGSVNATTLIFKDPNPVSAAFISGTVVVDGITMPEYNPITGFTLSDLMPNQSHTVTFNSKVTSIPPTNEIDNIANVNFNYKLTPSDTTENMTSYSNTAITYINLGMLTVTKGVNKVYATIGDILSYTISISNIGNTTCQSVFFKDIIQAEGTFVPGSVKVNTASKPDFNPNTGFALDNILKGGTTTVTFDITVNSLPANYYISNNSTVNYSYIINPSNQPVAATSTSNTVTTTINLGSLTVTKTTNKAYATINDIVSYTVVVANTGNVNASFVNFRDVVPNGLTFIANSVIINGEASPGYDPYQSFTLGTLVPGASMVVNFNARVTSVPNPSLVINTANIVFSYKVDPNLDYIVKETDSNPVTTQINLGQLTVTKSVDKNYATLTDILTYTMVVTNTGNIPATSVIFTDGIQAEASFVQNSVTVNGTSHQSYDPQVGFSLGDILPLSKVTITFQVTVNTLPVQSSITNIAVATFSYNIDPTGQTYTTSTQSNTISTIIILPGLTATKIVNQHYATVNDILEYTITVKNTGNTSDFNLFFIDTLSSGATFQSGSVTINDISQPTLNPTSGFNLSDLVSGNTAVIFFKATVTSVPAPPQVTNYATITGNYKIDPNGPSYLISTTSNTASTQINLGKITIVKTVDLMYAKVGDTLTYTNLITNAGNVTASSTLFADALQVEVQFISGTVSINNVIYPSLDPTVGFTINDMAPNQVVTVVFEVKINTLPVPPLVVNKSQLQFNYKIDPSGSLITTTTFSNTTTTNVVKGQLNVAKTVDKAIATIGDILTYNITLTNVGNVIDTSVLFQDIPSTGATFNTGSVIVNGVSQSSFDPTVGFSLADIGIGNVTTISFTATVTSVPPSNKVTNQATVNFKFTVDPKNPPFSATTYSNTTTTNIALGKLTVTKAVDKLYATKGDKLTYTVVITNIGNIDATNVVFLDATPANSTFVNGSVTVNGTSQPSYHPEVGFNLNTINPGQIITVSYKVQVN
ncbi:hypothetical protein [Clostridium sp.]|uniref:hypothetical protein n=1 Tax=Clostridium sp. TaxID=1506 RepID=UPI0032171BC7